MRVSHLLFVLSVLSNNLPWLKFLVFKMFLKYQNYLCQSKVLQYFGNMTHNSADSVAFADVVKMTNYTVLWDADLAWYSPKATHWISEFVKMTNHTGLWKADLAWYFPRTTHWICQGLWGFYVRLILSKYHHRINLEHSHGIPVLRPTWSSLIFEVLSTRAKFLQPSVYCAFTFYTTIVIGCFSGVMAQFEPVKHKFLN